MNRIVFTLIAVSMAAFFLSSCDGKYPGFEMADNGVYYKIYTRGNDSIHPEETDWVTISMDYRLKDTILFKHTMLKEPLRFQMIKPMFAGDLYEGLSLMVPGDSMSFVVVADSFFYKTAQLKKLPVGVKPGSLLYYDVKLLGITTQEEYMAEIEQKKEMLRQAELKKVEEYVENQAISVLPRQSGLYFIPLNKTKARVADTGEMCQVLFKVNTLDGKLLYDGFDKDPMDIEFGKEFDTQGLMEGLSLLPLGGRAQLIVPSSIGVGETGREGVQPFTTLIYEVELLQIRSVEEVKKERAAKRQAEIEENEQLKNEESAKIEKYIQENNIQERPMSSGLYLIPVKEGQGPVAKPGNLVKVNYIIYSIEGNEIESSYSTNSPAEFKVGTNQVFKAWEEAILRMKKGSKVKLVAPSSLAYGPGGIKGKIKPYSPLVFELEVLEIK